MIPGDIVKGQNFGPGTWASVNKTPFATVTGELMNSSRATYVVSNGKRYIPARQDFVIGIVTQKLSEVYRLQLQPQSRPVRLDIFAFEGANKKNRPQLQVGDAVYARVTHADTITEPELECVDTNGKAAGFGPLVGGTLVHVSLGYSRHLLFKGHPLLERIGEKYTFEMAIGVNGIIWIKTEDNELTMQISKWIQQAEHLTIKEALNLL